MQFADMHCDTIGRIYGAQKEGKTVSLRRNTYHLDLEKMKKANYLLQHFALFLSLEETEDAVKEGLDMLRCYKEQLAENSDLILPARNLQDILDNQKNGKMSAILTLEEGDITGGRPDALPKYAEEGVRMITLTWNHKNSLGSPNLTHDAQGNALISARCSEGLTENGIDFIQEMERLGILIDVSHLSDGGFWDVIHYTKKPFVASHSNAAALCPFCRNMTDDMIRALAERGGVMGLNFCGDFLTFPSPENPEPDYSRISAMVEHIRHIVHVGGMEVIGLGTDFDGIGSRLEIPDASYMPLLADALEKAGFSQNALEHIFYKNVLRMYA